MPPPRWFAVGSADGAEPDAGVRAANEALMYDDAKLLARTRGMRGFHNQTLVVLSVS
jgi:hypothetical protein